MCSLRASLGGADEALADHRTHRTGHELELERHATTGIPLSRPRIATRASFSLLVFCACDQPVPVFLAVFEFQKINRLDVIADFGRCLRQESSAGACGRQIHVVAALGTYLKIALQLGAVQHRPAFRALAPQTFGHLVFVAAVGANPRGNQFFVPAHEMGCERV
jgi:hypothetical protein